MDNSNDRMLFIDGLKGLSACVIAFVWHYQHFISTDLAPFRSIFKVSYAHGNRLVELFFLLSGFGMMLGYGEKVLCHKISFPQYMKKKILKIYPLFLLSTVLVLVLQQLIYQRAGEYFVYQNNDLYHLVLNLLMLQNGALETKWSFNSPSWFVSVLMLLYILFFFICYYAKKSRAVYYVFACGVIIGMIFTINNNNLPILNEQMGRGLSCFSMGVVMHGILKMKDKYQAERIGYFFLAFLVLTYMLLRLGKTAYLGNITLLMILGLSPMILFCVSTLPWMNKLLSWKPFVFLGQISMAVYLLHFPIQCIFTYLDVFFHIDFGKRSVWIAYVFMTIVFASAYTFLISKKYEPAITRFFQKETD